MLVAAFGVVALAKAPLSPHDRILAELRTARESGDLESVYLKYRRQAQTKPLETYVYGAVEGLVQLDGAWNRQHEGDAYALIHTISQALRTYPRSARLYAAQADFQYIFDDALRDPGDKSTSWAKVSWIHHGDGRPPSRSTIITGKSPEGLKIARASATRARQLAPGDHEIWLTSGIVEPDARIAYTYFQRAVELGGMQSSAALPLAVNLLYNGEAREDEPVVQKYGAWIKRYATEHPNSRRMEQLRKLRRFPE